MRIELTRKHSFRISHTARTPPSSWRRSSSFQVLLSIASCRASVYFFPPRACNTNPQKIDLLGEPCNDTPNLVENSLNHQPDSNIVLASDTTLQRLTHSQSRRYKHTPKQERPVCTAVPENFCCLWYSAALQDFSQVYAANLLDEPTHPLRRLHCFRDNKSFDLIDPSAHVLCFSTYFLESRFSTSVCDLDLQTRTQPSTTYSDPLPFHSGSPSSASLPEFLFLSESLKRILRRQRSHLQGFSSSETSKIWVGQLQRVRSQHGGQNDALQTRGAGRWGCWENCLDNSSTCCQLCFNEIS